MLWSMHPITLLEGNASQGWICKLCLVAMSVRPCVFNPMVLQDGKRRHRAPLGGHLVALQHLAFTSPLPAHPPSFPWWPAPSLSDAYALSCRDTLRTLAWVPAYILQDPALPFPLFPWYLCAPLPDTPLPDAPLPEHLGIKLVFLHEYYLSILELS